MRERKKPSLTLLDSTQQPAKVRANDGDGGPDFVHGSERFWGQLIFSLDRLPTSPRVSHVPSWWLKTTTLG
jgi:hypothetical protein